MDKAFEYVPHDGTVVIKTEAGYTLWVGSMIKFNLVEETTEKFMDQEVKQLKTKLYPCSQSKMKTLKEGPEFRGNAKVRANAVNRSIGTELPRPGSGTYMASGRISFEELLTSDPSLSKSSKDFPDAGFKPSGEEEKMDGFFFFCFIVNTINTASIDDNAIHKNIVYGCDDDPIMPNLEEIAYSIDDEDVGLTLVDLPLWQEGIGTKWVYRKQERLIEVLWLEQGKPGNSGLHSEEGIVYDDVFVLLLGLFRKGTIDKTLFIKKDKDDAQEIPNELYRGAHFLLRVAAVTPMETNKALLKDEEAADMDVHLYRSMIGSLMYLTASRPDIMFAVCAYARDSPFDLEAFSDSDYAGASLDRKSTTEDETVINEWEDRMERDATTASSLEAEQDSGNINRTQSMETLNESFSQGTDSDFGSGTRCQDTILGVQKLKLEIATLKDRVKKLEKKRRSRTYKPRRLYKVGLSRRIKSTNDASLGAQEDASKQGRKIVDLDADIEVTLIDEIQGRNDEDLMFDAGVLNSNEVFQEPIVNTDTTTKSSIPVSVVDPVTTTGEVVTTASVEILEELTLAQTLIEIKSTKPKMFTHFSI
ncbi:hypothetical protein Tco_0966360 [Tanacetum coccineum]